MSRWLLPALAIGLVLGYAIWRDVRFERSYTGDLRNRITGARMIKDGRSPYFYKWKAGDGLRYYDPQNFDDFRPAHMTSTPVLYRLLSPLVEMPQATVSRWWLVLEYVMLASLGLWAFLRAKTPSQKEFVLLAFCLILLTNGWKQHVANGQTYICIPFFAMLFLAFWENGDHPVGSIAAGIAALCLIGIRLNTALFFVPFLFLLPQYSRSRILYFCVPLVLYLGWTMANPHERSLWRDYSNNLQEAARLSQNLPVDTVHNTPDPRYRVWEGIDTVQYSWQNRHLPAPIYSENANVFVLVNRIFHFDLSIRMLALLAMGSIAVIVALYFFRCRLPVLRRMSPRLRVPPASLDVSNAAILGVCLFMIADLCSPIYRHQYYTVQWIFPLLLAASAYDGRRKGLYALLLAALVLNCIHLPFVKMGNSIGEYGMLLTFLAMVLGFGVQKTQKPQPASLPESG